MQLHTFRLFFRIVQSGFQMYFTCDNLSAVRLRERRFTIGLVDRMQIQLKTLRKQHPLTLKQRAWVAKKTTGQNWILIRGNLTITSVIFTLWRCRVPKQEPGNDLTTVLDVNGCISPPRWRQSKEWTTTCRLIQNMALHNLRNSNGISCDFLYARARLFVLTKNLTTFLKYWMRLFPYRVVHANIRGTQLPLLIYQ